MLSSDVSFTTSPGSSNQLLSPECWKVTLRVLGCLPPSRSTKSKAEQADVLSHAAGLSASPFRSPISLSPQQVTNAGVNVRLKPLTCCITSLWDAIVTLSWNCMMMRYFIGCSQVDETVDWLSDYFLRSRVSKADLRSFGLYSAWAPYISEVVAFWDHLISCLVNVQLSSCARESVGSSKILKGKWKCIVSLWSFIMSVSWFVHISSSYVWSWKKSVFHSSAGSSQ